jgi:hypothetical protein
MNAATGSQGFVAAARATWLFTRETDDAGTETGRTLMLPVKDNLSARRHNGMAYASSAPTSVTGSVRRTSRGTTSRSRCRRTRRWRRRWRVQAAGGDDDALGVAMTFLEDEFSVTDRIEASEITAWARRAGISERTLKRARQKLGVEAKREGFGTGSKFYLTLPRSKPIEGKNDH